MCLAMPMRLTGIDGVRGRGELDGVEKEINLGFLEDARLGDYVLVHAGFAIETLDEAEALRGLAELREMIERGMANQAD